jgi:hypothetical protein
MCFHDPSIFDEDLLVRPEFIPILKSANKSIYEPLKELIVLYHNLPFGYKKQLEIALSVNNSIDLFSNKDSLPIKFKDLHPAISEKLKTFFENLWNNYTQVVQMDTDFGTVKDHYDKLTHEDNCIGIVCPFCGIETFEPSGGNYREDYDHLLAKATYPFVSINFNLLFPCCKKCNSNEKRSTDTLFKDNGERRVTYYPYDENITPNDLEINIVLNEAYNNRNLETLLRSINWEFDIKRNKNADERLESWDGIYNIKRRYTERLKRLEKTWFYELHSGFKKSLKHGESFDDFKTNILDESKKQVLVTGMGIIKYSYFNFLFSLNSFEASIKALN